MTKVRLTTLVWLSAICTDTQTFCGQNEIFVPGNISFWTLGPETRLLAKPTKHFFRHIIRHSSQCTFSTQIGASLTFNEVINLTKPKPNWVMLGIKYLGGSKKEYVA